DTANFGPLTPLGFYARKGAVFSKHGGAGYEGRSFTLGEAYARRRRVAFYLASKGIGEGGKGASVLAEGPAVKEVDFGVTVLNALNIRLDAPSIAFQLDHGGAKIILVDPEFSGVIIEAMGLMNGPKPLVVDVDDAAFQGGKRIGEIEYEAALGQGNPDFVPR